MAVVGLLLFWPVVFLCAGVAILIGAAGAVVNSLAFPLLIASTVASAVAFGVAVHAAWRRFHDHVDIPLRSVVIAEAVILAVAFALFCAATFYGANALVDWLQA